ncbi:hypothetical protein BKH46_06720 [Helicobacter sp. 12S02634-8]|uniref:DUF7488 domain-containing protein n=1 Tax=Helicobacter sp. 12S02634-8 TaxID=1476199 RepID=UPI000BA522B5|nr:PDZ domain-containing protein [Helicobacter sp. 12S02634-8]PAF46656.1 hypothetical protein BKH46_06720 [Helicobacter sp. 12S02634-8]
MMAGALCLRVLFVALVISSSFGYDFSYCAQYYQKASTPLAGGYRTVSIASGGAVVSVLFAPLPPQGLKILKADPFIGLYLVQTPLTPYAYHLLPIDGRIKGRELSALTPTTYAQGKILNAQKGFTHYAKFSAPIARNGVVGNICYQIYGIGVGGEYFIDKPYLERFLHQKTPYYGDIGIRVVPREGQLVVYQIDPFFKQNPFLPGDILTSINDKKLRSYQEFEWISSNLAYGKPASIEIIRNGKPIKVQVLTDRRYGGFLLPDTFLERFGVRLDKELVVTHIDTSMPNAKIFKPQDRLVWINKKPILQADDDTKSKAEEALREALSQAGVEKNIEILIMRDGLEFYLKL